MKKRRITDSKEAALKEAFPLCHFSFGNRAQREAKRARYIISVDVIGKSVKFSNSFYRFFLQQQRLHGLLGNAYLLDHLLVFSYIPLCLLIYVGTMGTTSLLCLIYSFWVYFNITNR